MEALENCRVTRLFAVTSLVKNILSYVSMETKKSGLEKAPKLSKVLDAYISGFFFLKMHFLIDLPVGMFS